MPSAPYYMDVRHLRSLTLLFLLPLALLPGCNRGAHPAQLGTRAPDFTISDGATTINLASYRGKVVLLNFWATWCPPCVQEMPSLSQLHRDDPNLVILAVSIDENADDYKSFIRERHIEFTTVRDPQQKAASLFHTEKWPETYIIDRNGIIRRKFIGAQDWTDPEIRQFLNSL